MPFWYIYWPTFAAFLSAFMIREVIRYTLGYYFYQKQQRLQKELEDKIASGEIDPRSLGLMGSGNPLELGFSGLPTLSGNSKKTTDNFQGQYL